MNINANTLCLLKSTAKPTAKSTTESTAKPTTEANSLGLISDDLFISWIELN